VFPLLPVDSVKMMTRPPSAPGGGARVPRPRTVQETGRRWVPDTGVNVYRFWMLKSGVPVQEVEREACTGGGKESPFWF
jgi:hypothetical protein